MKCDYYLKKPGDRSFKFYDTCWSIKELEHEFYQLFKLRFLTNELPIIAEVRFPESRTGKSSFWVVARMNRAAWGHITLQRFNVRADAMAVLDFERKRLKREQPATAAA